MSARATRRPLRDPGTWNPRRSLVARLALVRRPGRARPGGCLLGHRGPHRRRAAGAASCRRFSPTLAATRRRTLSAGGGRPRSGDRRRRAATSSTSSRQAAAEAARALEAGPDPNLPPEELVDEPGGLLRSAGSGVSAAMVSRQRGLDRRGAPGPRRDAPSRGSVRRPRPRSRGPVRPRRSVTASGVLRVVPGLDLKPGGRPVVDPAFRFPERPAAASLADGTGGTGSPPVVWSRRLRRHVRRKREHRVGRRRS